MTGNYVVTSQAIIFTGLISACVSVSIYYLIKTKLKNSPPKKWQEVAKVKKLFLYPLKSGKRIEISEANVTCRGFQEMNKFDKSIQLRDRCLVVYQEGTYEFRTARTHQSLALIEVNSDSIDGFTMKAPDMESCFVKIPKGKKIHITQFKDERIEYIDCGDEVAQWISRYILKKDSGLRLAYNDASHLRDISKKYKSFIKYYKDLSNNATGLHHDLCAVHLINQASIDDVNEKLEANWVSVNNFRANILIKGDMIGAFEEDKWKWVKIGDVVLRNVMECTRCIMTTIDWEHGIRRRDEEPLKTMKKYRNSQGPSKSPVMGTYYEVVETGVISINDKVYIA